jgi:hypothetical protein
MTQGVGVALSLAGIVIGFVAAVSTANDTEQPSVTLKLNDETLTATGSAKVANLSSSERLAVFVDGLQLTKDGRYSPTNLTQAFVGPNGDGEASQELEVHVPPGRYDALGVRAFTGESPQRCGKYARGSRGGDGSGTGCVVIRLPTRLARPQLTATWIGKSLGRTVKLGLTIPAATAGGTGGVPFGLLVVGRRGNRKLRLYRAIVSPAARGATGRELELPVEKGLQLVCAQATLEQPNARPVDMACPIHRVRQAVVAVELRVPPS